MSFLSLSPFLLLFLSFSPVPSLVLLRYEPKSFLHWSTTVFGHIFDHFDTPHLDSCPPPPPAPSLSSSPSSSFPLFPSSFVFPSRGVVFDIDCNVAMRLLFYFLIRIFSLILSFFLPFYHSFFIFIYSLFLLIIQVIVVEVIRNF